MRWKENEMVRVAVFLLVLTLVFFGRVLVPAEGWALGGLDVRGLFYPWLELLRNSVFSGYLPWWDGNTFAGYPFLSNPQVAVFYPLTWLAVLLPVRIGITVYVVAHVWLGGMGMYGLVRALGFDAKAQRREEDKERNTEAQRHGGTERGRNGQLTIDNWQLSIGSLVAAVTFMFSGFFTARIYAGHIGLIGVHVWVPWILWGTLWCVRRGGVWSAVVAGVPWGMAVLAGHTTSLLYVGVVWGCFVVFLVGGGWWVVGSEGSERRAASGERVITNYQLLIIRQVLVMGVMGLLLALVQLVPLVEFARVAGRTADADFGFATGFSFPPSHLVTLLVPHFFGEPVLAGYWSVPNFEELAAYAGVVPLIGLIMALRRPNRQTVLWVGLMVLGVLLAFGSYGFLYRLFFDYVPGFRLARAPGRAMFLYVLGAAVLLGVTVDTWWREAQETRWLKWVMGVGFVAGLTTVAATGAVFASVHPSDVSGRLWWQIGGWVVATVVFVVGGEIFRRKGAKGQRGERKGGREELGGRAGEVTSREDNTEHATRNMEQATWNMQHILLVGLVVVDLWLFGFKFVRVEPMTPDLFWFEVRDVVAADGGDGRVLPWGVSIFSQNGAAQVGLESVFGYNALEVGANNQLAASVPDPRSTAYDILGARYAVSMSKLDQFTEGDAGLRLVGNNGSAWVYERPRVLPLVRLVGDVEVIAEREAAIARVHAGDFDAGRTVIVDGDVGCDVGEGGGSAEIVERRPGYWRIETESGTAQVLVVSETAYPGWEVLIDGEAAEWVTAYTAVRAVCVPSGAHEVEWVYRPWVYVYGGVGSLVGLGLVVVGVWVVWKEE